VKNQFSHATVVYVTPKSVDTRLIFVPPVYNLEDRLEKLAITKMWPLMKRDCLKISCVQLVSSYLATLMPVLHFRNWNLITENSS
jgi:hypothetical protein